MRRKIAVVLTNLLLVATAVSAPKGTVPRSAARSYPAHAERDGISIGAKLLSKDETRKQFVSDLNRCCVVVEVAIYPQADKPTAVSLNDFTVWIKGQDTSKKPGTAKVIAASLQQKAAADRDITVYPTTGIGYSSGTVYDPNTGTRRAGGVYTQAGVGVGIGGPGQGPASSEKDRAVMETELSDKGLPEGDTKTPIAGYVYFLVPQGKKKVTYQLQYVVNGSKVMLELPLQ